MSILATLNPEEHILRKFFKKNGITAHQLANALQTAGIRFGYSAVSIYLRGFTAPRADVEAIFHQIVDELQRSPNRNTTSTAKTDSKLARLCPAAPGNQSVSSSQNHTPPRLHKRRKIAS